MTHVAPLDPSSLDPSSGALHASAHRDGDAVVTSRECWAYAMMFPLAALPGSPGDWLTVTMRVAVDQGRIGVGCLNATGDAFLVERTVAAPVADVAVTLRLQAASSPSRLVIRNTSPDGPSRFRVLDASFRRGPLEHGYPVAVPSRVVRGEPVPPAGGVEVFGDDAAVAINRARMDFIRSLELPLRGRRVLDVGCGVGHFARMYRDLGAEVVAVDGRAENIREMARLYPDVEGHVGDVQTMDLDRFGAFDLVHCFGLLYHLDSPVTVLRRMEAVCREWLLVETMICDAVRPIMVLADETMALNQALAGLGCRPSPSFVAMAMNRAGFAHVYGPASPPDHPDFRFDWLDNLESSRNGHNLRGVFVGSRQPLRSDALRPLIES